MRLKSLSVLGVCYVKKVKTKWCLMSQFGSRLDSLGRLVWELKEKNARIHMQTSEI